MSKTKVGTNAYEELESESAGTLRKKQKGEFCD